MKKIPHAPSRPVCRPARSGKLQLQHVAVFSQPEAHPLHRAHVAFFPLRRFPSAHRECRTVTIPPNRLAALPCADRCRTPALPEYSPAGSASTVLPATPRASTCGKCSRIAALRRCTSRWRRKPTSTPSVWRRRKPAPEGCRQTSRAAELQLPVGTARQERNARTKKFQAPSTARYLPPVLESGGQTSSPVLR